MLGKPMAIYEVHLGSGKNTTGAGGHRWLYELPGAGRPACGVCHLYGLHPCELIGITNTPSRLLGLSGHGFYAPTSRYGTPEDFRVLWTRCTKTVSASSWTGCRPTSPRTALDWSALTVRRCTSPRIPCGRSTRNGAPKPLTLQGRGPPFLISNAFIGCGSSTLTPCASMRGRHALRQLQRASGGPTIRRQ